MTGAPFRFEPLHSGHDRAAFRCGNTILDRYLQTQAAQDMRRRVANCFVILEAGRSLVAAYYTLSGASLPLADLPPEVSRKLPRYPTVPAVLIGRLAVDQRFQRRGLGELILMDATRRTLQDSAAAYALLVEAKDIQAAAYYQRYGFRAFRASPNTMWLSLDMARKLLLSSG